MGSSGAANALGGYDGGSMKLIRNKADVGYLILLTVVVLAGAALALSGREEGLFILLLILGVALGFSVAYVATKPRRTRVPVALLLLAGAFSIPAVGIVTGIGWIFPGTVSGSPYSALPYGLFMGVLQATFFRLFGRITKTSD